MTVVRVQGGKRVVAPFTDRPPTGTAPAPPAATTPAAPTGQGFVPSQQKSFSLPDDAAPGFLDLADLYENPPDPSPRIVDRLLRSGERLVLVAPRNLGKSWAVLQLAQEVARGGGSFLGFKVSQQTNVLALLGETDDEALHERLVAQGYGPLRRGVVFYDASGRSHISVESETENVIRGDRQLRRTRTMAELPQGLEQAITDRGIGLLIVDPWAAFYRGDENSNDQVSRALSELDGVIYRTGVAVVITHHPAKSSGKVTQNAAPEDTWRGASRLADWATVRLTVREHFTMTEAKNKGLSRMDARRTVDVSVLTRGRPIADFVMTADTETRRWSISDLAPTHATVKLSAEQAAAACRDAGGFESTRGAGDAMKVAPATALAALEDAERVGLVVRGAGDRNATTWKVTPA